MAVSFLKTADKFEKGKGSRCISVPKGVEFYKPKQDGETIRIVFLPYETTQSRIVAPGDLYFITDYWQWNGLGENQKGSCIDVDRTYGKKCPIRNALQNFSGAEKDKPRSQHKVLANLWFPDTGEVKLIDYSYMTFWEPLYKDIKLSLKKDEERAAKGQKPKFPGLDAFFDPAGPQVIEITFEEDSFGGSKFYKAVKFDYEPYENEDTNNAIPEEILAKALDLDAALNPMSYDEMVAKFINGEGDDEEEIEDEVEDTPALPPAKATKPAPKDEEPEEKPAPKAKAKTEKPAIESLTVGQIMVYDGEKVEVVSVKDGVVKVKDSEGDILKVKESDLKVAKLADEEPPKKAKTSKAAKQEAPADDDGDEPWDKWVKDDE